MHRTYHRPVRLTVVATAAAAVLAACSGGGSDAPAKKDGATTSPTPAASPAEKIVAPLLDRDEVDVAGLELPPSPAGNPAAWQTSAMAVREMAVASQATSLWSARPGAKVVAKVAAAAPPQVERSMNDLDDVKDEPATSLFWAPTFADGARPTASKVVDARWTKALSTDGNFLPIAILELTTAYTFEEATPVVLQRRFTLGTQRSLPDLGAFRWSVDLETGGVDECRLWTDGVIAPSDDADLDQLQTLVDHVVDQTAVDTETQEDDSVAALRKEACGDRS